LLLGLPIQQQRQRRRNTTMQQQPNSKRGCRLRLSCLRIHNIWH